MENNESNLKPQPTGGLKLMTVFIAVLALHVLVIGGFTVYHLLSVATSDQDLTLDKSHKAAKVLADGSLAGDLPGTDGASSDKTITPPASTDGTAATASSDGSTTTPANDTATPSAPAATTGTAPATPPVATTESASPAPTAQTPSGPIQHGPVIDPPENLAPKETATLDSSALGATPPAAEAAPTTEGLAYIVKPGDSLARIARQHHLTLAKLRAANSFTSDRLHIGQKIALPGRTETATMTAETETEPTPAMDGPAPTTPSPHHAHLTGKMAATAGGHHLYTVVKGDTLTKIARKFRTTPTALMSANNLTNAGKLSIGKKLRIPSGESRSAAASVPPGEPAAPADTKPGPKGQLANFVQ